MKTKNSINFLIKNAAFLLLAIILITSCKKDKIDNGSGNEPIPEEPGIAITNPLCFTAEEDRVSIEIYVREDCETTFDFEYSYDNVEWNRFIPNYTIIVLAEAGEKVYFRGHNPQGLSPNHDVFDEETFYFWGPCAKFVTNDKSVALSGNVMSLIDTVYRATKPLPKSCFAGLFEYTSVTSAPELPATLLSECCYTHMFSLCSKLVSAPELPATVLTKHCYSDMFANCSSMTEAPELPATTLAEYCYKYMFGCCSFTTAPELPATTMKENCYRSMFSGCTSLEAAPELPAMTLAENCYYDMFWGCRFETAPRLPATTLANGCYSCMFTNCPNLTTAPELPATNLADYCYTNMFAYCDNLTEAPKLPATTLAEYCYYAMFNFCRSLITPPELPATELAAYCYSFMFQACNNMTSAPELPATTLAPYCYEVMFDMCSEITAAPELPATTLVEGCYIAMFSNCDKINSVRVLFTEWNDEATDWWFGDTNSYGTFYCPSSLPQDFGCNRIPTNWTVETL